MKDKLYWDAQGSHLIWSLYFSFYSEESRVESGGICWCWRYVGYSWFYKQCGEALGTTVNWWRNHSVTKALHSSWWTRRM